FRAIHSFLTHTSNVSKLLWPPGTERRKNESEIQYHKRCEKDKRVARALSRAVELRQTLRLPDDDHPLKNRTLRDQLEHFDERLDRWQETSSSHNYFQDYIGTQGSIVGASEGDIMRWFNPSTATFIFRGESYSLQELATAVEETLPIVLQSYSNEAYRQAVLREENPELLVDWERSELFSLVIQDPRLKPSDVRSIFFHPYGAAADIDLGPNDVAQKFSIPLPPTQVPGPKSQIKGVADIIVREICRQKQTGDNEAVPSA
ncbi:MAG: hypothetical protein ACJ74G_01885, partial [Blastocatellia bacterium]